MSVTLYKSFSVGMTDYIDKHNSNYTIIETNLNTMLSMLTGQTGQLAVPLGLQQIFDRKGVIGIGSYDFTEGTLSGPNYNLTIQAGAFWDGSSSYLYKNATTTLSFAGRSTGTYYITLDAAGTPAIGTSPSTNTVRSLSWNASTHVISDKALYTGVNILFDGDDYHDCLSSEARSVTFEKLADRLEAIESLTTAMSGYYAYQSDDGLDFYYEGGVVRNDADIYETVAGYVTLTANATNYVEVDPTDGTVSANTTGFTSGSIPLWEVTTDTDSVTGMEDRRTWAVAGTGGGGGGHTQNTDVGTSSATWTLNRDVAGTPSEDCKLEVERGTESNVAIRWNETTNKWEFTNDGISYVELGALDMDVGGQLNTKYVSVENPPKVWEEVGRGDSLGGIYEELDLSSYITAPQGVEAVILKVFFWDDAPGSAVKVMFRKKNSPYLPLYAFSAWKDQYQPVTIIVPVDEFSCCEFLVEASGSDTANLTVFLIGYFEKIIGVGTQKVTFIEEDLVVAAATTEDFDLSDFLNRGLVHYLKIEETGGLLTGTYDVVLSKGPSPTGPPYDYSEICYYATSIVPTTDYEDWEPFWIEDESEGSELHLRIKNNDATHQGTFKITMIIEQFA